MEIAICALNVSRAGGVNQYSFTLVDVFAEIADADSANRYTLIFDAAARDALAEYIDDRWSAVSIESAQGLAGRARDLKRLASARLPFSGALRRLRQRAARAFPRPMALGTRSRGDTSRLISQLGADLVWFTAPTTLGCEARVRYVMPVHDLQHRLQPHFPEVSDFGEWEAREHMYSRAVPQAFRIVVDSEVGRADVTSCYEIPPERVEVLPFLPSHDLARHADVGRDALRRHTLPSSYFLYPAVTWPHKNHASVVRAVAALKRKGVRVDVVFTGHAADLVSAHNLRSVMYAARVSGVAEQVHHLGHVSARELAALYRHAVALVMPTFFGPTQIPVYEAWSLGCPVITSDIRGTREQVGDAGILVEPGSVTQIANAMERLLFQPALRESLAKRGRVRQQFNTRDKFTEKVKQVLFQAGA